MYLGHLRADKIKPALIYGTSRHISFWISLARISTPLVNSKIMRVRTFFCVLVDFIDQMCEPRVNNCLFYKWTLFTLQMALASSCICTCVILPDWNQTPTVMIAVVSEQTFQHFDPQEEAWSHSQSVRHFVMPCSIAYRCTRDTFN